MPLALAMSAYIARRHHHVLIPRTCRVSFLAPSTPIACHPDIKLHVHRRKYVSSSLPYFVGSRSSGYALSSIHPSSCNSQNMSLVCAATAPHSHPTPQSAEFFDGTRIQSRPRKAQSPATASHHITVANPAAPTL